VSGRQSRAPHLTGIATELVSEKQRTLGNFEVPRGEQLAPDVLVRFVWCVGDEAVAGPRGERAAVLQQEYARFEDGVGLLGLTSGPTDQPRFVCPEVRPQEAEWQRLLMRWSVEVGRRERCAEAFQAVRAEYDVASQAVVQAGCDVAHVRVQADVQDEYGVVEHRPPGQLSQL
jgi:hypothetical protein